jgi:hypothetical protein
VARRTIDLSSRYLNNAGTLGVVGGSGASRSIARIALHLAEADVLPEPGDLTTLAAPDERGVMMLTHVRRIEGRNLWLWYASRGEKLLLVALTSTPP